MFKNRAITVKVDKVDKHHTAEKSCDDKTFEEKADIVLHILEGLGVKLFLGVCVYVILDTQRQVAVAKINK